MISIPTPQEILKIRIKESGLSATRFAREVMWRNERTIRRWLNGDSPIPEVVMARLVNPRIAPWPKKN
jgi:plasmid maintenance system antidote protein VapI